MTYAQKRVREFFHAPHFGRHEINATCCPETGELIVLWCSTDWLWAETVYNSSGWLMSHIGQNKTNREIMWEIFDDNRSRPQ